MKKFVKATRSVFLALCVIFLTFSFLSEYIEALDTDYVVFRIIIVGLLALMFVVWLLNIIGEHLEKLQSKKEQDLDFNVEGDGKYSKVKNIKDSAFGGKTQIARFILLLSPLFFMCMPMYTELNRETFEFTEISLITLIKSIITTVFNSDNGGMTFDMWLSDKAYLFTFISIVFVVVFTLIELISSFFSIGESALVRNRIINAVNYLVLFVLFCLPIVNGFGYSIGVNMILYKYLAVDWLHKSVDEKLN